MRYIKSVLKILILQSAIVSVFYLPVHAYKTVSHFSINKYDLEDVVGKLDLLTQ